MTMRSAIVCICAAIVVHQATMVQAQLSNIVQTAINANFTTLVAALQATNLTTALSGPGPFTVFAPNDAAFAKLGLQATNLSLPLNQLTQILLYHVIGNSNLTSAAILNMSLPVNVTTLKGDSVTVSRNGNSIMVNNANVIQANVMASNGIIHVIDTVLIPPAATTNSAPYFNGNQGLFSLFVFSILFSFLHL